jgi:adenylate cyclase
VWLDTPQVTAPVRVALPTSVGLGHLPLQIYSESFPFEAQPKLPEPDANLQINTVLSADLKLALPVEAIHSRDQKRLEMLYDLPLQFAAEQDLTRLYSMILDRVLQLMPGAMRGALLIKDPYTGKLALKASVPADTPPISRTLILRAAREQNGFIWGDSDAEQENLSLSMAAIKIRSGMYAPLVWKGESIGVLFVDNPVRRSAFEEGDLRFLLSVAQYAASAVANQLLQTEITQNNLALEHLLANFSPKIRSRLLEKSRQGRLQPGGEKSHVTILLSDLRGFTRTSATLDASIVVEMLNDYFSVLGEEIFRYDGTIDKFIGDAILAVYGSPEPDEHHAWKAVCSAIQMQRRMAVVNQRRQAAGLPHCELGIGIYTGEVLHGFIGAEDCLEYTVIGDTVNKASRYCDGAQGGQIVLGPLTHDSIREHMHATETRISTKHEGELPAWVVDWE